MDAIPELTKEINNSKYDANYKVNKDKISLTLLKYKYGKKVCNMSK